MHSVRPISRLSNLRPNINSMERNLNVISVRSINQATGMTKISRGGISVFRLRGYLPPEKTEVRLLALFMP